MVERVFMFLRVGCMGCLCLLRMGLSLLDGVFFVRYYRRCGFLFLRMWVCSLFYVVRVFVYGLRSLFI